MGNHVKIMWIFNNDVALIPNFKVMMFILMNIVSATTETLCKHHYLSN